MITAPYSADLETRIKTLFPDTLTVLFIDPSRALSALRTLSAAPSSSVAVQRYQDDFDGSRIASLTHAIRELLAASSHILPRSVSPALHVHTAQANVAGSLDACNIFLARALREIDELCLRVGALKDRVEEVRVRVPQEVFGAAGEGADEIQLAVGKAKRDIGVVMGTLTWWRLLWRADDLSEVVGAAIDRAWCKDLESKVRALVLRGRGLI